LNIIVAGGAGFIGSHLCEYLLQHGDTVWCIDNLSTGRRENIEHLEGVPEFHFWKWDVREPYGGYDIDRIYNLACPASPKHYMADPIGTINTCVKGMINALRVGCRVLQASTSEVYGDPMFPVQDESYFGNVNCFGPRACYDEGKRIAETICFEHWDKVEVRVARIFNTYGPRMDRGDGRVVPEFICNALEGKPLVINGDGHQTRSFCYIDDMIRGLVALMESEVKTPVNLGNPVEQEVLELACQVIEDTDSDSDITFGPAVQDDPRRRRPDITRAKTLLGWYPTVGMEQGLEKTIEYFKARVAVGK
jgi:UDP-glucuronate decarboxylase